MSSHPQVLRYKFIGEYPYDKSFEHWLIFYGSHGWNSIRTKDGTFEMGNPSFMESYEHAFTYLLRYLIATDGKIQKKISDIIENHLKEFYEKNKSSS